MSSGACPSKCHRFNFVTLTFQLTTFWGMFSDEFFPLFLSAFLTTIFVEYIWGNHNFFLISLRLHQSCSAMTVFQSFLLLIIQIVTDCAFCKRHQKESEEWVEEFWIYHLGREARYTHLNCRFHGLMEYFLRVFISSCSEPKQNCRVELKSELYLLRGLHRFLLPSSIPEICWQTELLLWARSLYCGKLLFLFLSVSCQVYVIDVTLNRVIINIGVWSYVENIFILWGFAFLISQ